MKALICGRCSTDEAHQDVEVQLKELRRTVSTKAGSMTRCRSTAPVTKGTSLSSRKSSIRSGLVTTGFYSYGLWIDLVGSS